MNFNKKLAVAVSGAVLLMAGQFALADSTSDIVDALVSKGVLTEEEGKLISKGHETKKKAEGNIGFKNGFKINSGDGKSNFSVNGRIQADYRYFDTLEHGPTVASANPSADTFDIRRAYFGAKGTFRNFINWEATTNVAGSSSMKYMWLEAAFSDKVKVRFGQFKPMFGLEQNTSSRFIDMTERDWVASMAPGVTRGIMIHGSPYTGVNYGLAMNTGSTAASYMADAGEGVNDTFNNGDGKQYTANVRVNIAEIIGNKEAIMHVGGSIASDTDASKPVIGSLSFRTNSRGTIFYNSETTLAGQTIDITRAGLEGIGAYGPFKLQAEWAQMGFSNTGVVATNNKDINALYVNASYMLTGESYASAYKSGVMDRMSPKADYLGLGSSGWGAWEIGVRYSKFDATDLLLATATAGSGANSDNVHSYSAGVKWITDPNTRFMLDYVHTDFGRYITGNLSSSAVYANAASFPAAIKQEKAVNLRAQFDF